jgi:hypothetical protein
MSARRWLRPLAIAIYLAGVLSFERTAFAEAHAEAAAKSPPKKATRKPKKNPPPMQAEPEPAAPPEAPAPVEPPPEPTPPPPPPEETLLEKPAPEPEAPEAPRYERLWIGAAGALDLVVLPSGVDLCKLTSTGAPANGSHAYCTNPDGSDFPTHATSAQNDALVAGRAGGVHGGLQLGDVRAMLAVDYALSPSLLVGVRVGYVRNTYPGTVAVVDGRAFGHPLHAEARVTYLFGDGPLARVGFAPMVFVGGGISEFDGHLASNVTSTGIAGSHPVNVWITDGPGFVTLGGGLRYGFSLRAAFTAAVRANAAFPGNGLLPTAGPEVGFQYGL